MIIVIEGPDGAGKTSVAEAVSKVISGKVIHFPDYEGVTGPMIRSYLRDEWRIYQGEGKGDLHLREDSTALAFQALNIANRMERMPEINQAAGSQTMHVVLVRYWQSGWVYGQLDGLKRDWLMNSHAGMARPDLNILLSLDVEGVMARRAKRDGDVEPERYEGQIAMTTRIVKLYHELWSDVTLRQPFSNPNCRWTVVDASQSLESVIADAACAVWKVQTR